MEYGSSTWSHPKQLPANIRFVSSDQLPLKRPSRLMSSAQEQWQFMVRNFNYSHESFLKLACMSQNVLLNDYEENVSAANKPLNNIYLKSPSCMVIYVFVLMLANHKATESQPSLDKSSTTQPSTCPKNRTWERRQTTYKAAWLKIDNVARVQRARVRQKLRSAPDWQDLSTEEKREREGEALLEVNWKQQEKRRTVMERFLKHGDPCDRGSQGGQRLGANGEGKVGQQADLQWPLLCSP